MLKITERTGNAEKGDIDMFEFTTIETQEELDRIVKERLARQKEKYSDYDELKERVQKLEKENVDLQATIEESGQSKTEQEQHIAELEAKISGYETEKMRTRVALEYGLPIDMAGRLQGDDENALKADAELLAGFMKAKEPKSPLKSTEPPIGDKNGWAELARNLTEGE